MKKKTTKKMTLGASSAAQWSKCSGLLDLEKNPNPYQDSSRADFGTAVHSIAEDLLLNGIKQDWPELNYEQVEERATLAKNTMLTSAQLTALDVDEDVTEYVRFYYECIRQDVLLEQSNLTADRSLAFHTEIPMGYETDSYVLRGIADFVMITTDYELDEVWVYVYDLKLGRMVVEAENNIQLATYGHLVADNIVHNVPGSENFKVNIYGTIIQPPMSQKKTARFQYHKNFLNALYTEPKKRKFTTGNQCHYCDYNDVCPTLQKARKKFLNPTFLDENISRPDKWPELLQLAGPIKKMAEQVTKTANTFAFEGVEIPGYSIEHKNGNRRFIQAANSAYIQKKLKLKKADVMKPAVAKSVKQIEDVIKKGGNSSGKLQILDDLSYKPQIAYLKKDLTPVKLSPKNKRSKS